MKNMIFTLYPLFCILLPCVIYILLQILLAHKKTNMVHIVWVGIFLVYVYLVLETTGIGTIWESGQYAGMEFQKEINLVPFHNGDSSQYDFKCRDVYAAWIFIAFDLEKLSKPVSNCSTGFGFSFGIEFCQLFNRRVSDVEDLLMNMLGTMLGWGIWLCFSYIVRLKYGCRNEGFRKENNRGFIWFFLYLDSFSCLTGDGWSEWNRIMLLHKK